jgi:Tfp pilus assembly protein PilO
VKFASHSLVSEALCWWDNIMQAMGTKAIERMKWKEFKQLVTDQYCQASELTSLEKKFINLEAGSMTHQEYTTKFNRMAPLLPDMVKPDSKRVDRYIAGLPLDINKHVISARQSNVSSVVNLSRVLYLERGEVALIESKKKWEGKNGKGNNKRYRGEDQGGRYLEKGRVEEIAVCKQCGRRHVGECKEGTRACYRCCKEGHLANVFPNM